MTNDFLLPKLARETLTNTRQKILSKHRVSNDEMRGSFLLADFPANVGSFTASTIPSWWWRTLESPTTYCEGTENTCAQKYVIRLYRGRGTDDMMVNCWKWAWGAVCWNGFYADIAWETRAFLISSCFNEYVSLKNGQHTYEPVSRFLIDPILAQIYYKLSNKQIGSKKRVGWIFSSNLIIE